MTDEESASRFFRIGIDTTLVGRQLSPSPPYAFGRVSSGWKDIVSISSGRNCKADKIGLSEGQNQKRSVLVRVRVRTLDAQAAGRKMTPFKTHILSSLVLAILASGALCKTVDNPGAEEDEESDTSDGPEKVEHKAVTYHAYKVLEAIPESKEQVKVLKKLEKHSDAPGFEFWKGPHHVNDTCSLSVAPNLVEVMQTYLEMKGIKHKVAVEDLQELIDQERQDILELIDQERQDILGDDDGEEGLVNRIPSQSLYSHKNYNNLETIKKFSRELQSQHPGLVRISSIGTTHEGRQIEMVTASVNDGAARAGIVIDCGVHAREWVSPSFCMYALEQLLRGGKMGMLGHFDFYVIPVLNPDGYHYSWTTNRMWRKNMRPVGAGSGGSSAASPVHASSPWPVAVEPVAVAASAKSGRSADSKVDPATKQFWGGVFPGKY